VTGTALPTRTDSRRLTGPNRLLPRAGAIIDAALADADADRVLAAWRAQARRILAAVGWPDEELAVLRFPGGASVAFTAPPDALYSATDVNEWAWDAAVRLALDGAEPALEEAEVRLRARIAGERNPALAALRDAARRRRVAFLADNQLATVGEGTGARTYPVAALPDVAAVPWDSVHDVPTVLVTGSNGKTTTVRLLAAIVRAAGRTAGLTSTDGVQVGGEWLARGDYSGPEGARLALRDGRVETAILETARGGILRRGLAVEHADVAVVTNIAEDHFGEFGVHDCASLADAKLVVARVVGREGRVVLNAGNRWLVEAAPRVDAPIVWFASDGANDLVRRHVAAGGEACIVEDGHFVLQRGATRETVAPVAAVPITFGGRARHNVENALAAIAGARALGIHVDAIVRGLLGFAGSAADNPGRANLFELGGVRVVLDFAHNPDGMAALAGVAEALAGARRLVTLGQAGDRDDDAIRALARAALAARPDRVIIKELDKYRRGRPAGEVPALLADEFRRAGLPPDAVSQAPDDMAALRAALAWARDGDVLLATIHVDQAAALELLTRLRSQGWRAGDPVSPP
jgi:cyanophycin synthetase